MRNSFVVSHTIPVMTKKGRKTAYFISGILAGAANGLIGGGGGMLVVPCLSRFGMLEEKEAHATAIAVMTPLSFLSVLVYTVKGVSDFSAAWKVSVGVVLGGFIGAVLLKKVSRKMLTIVFYAIMIYAGIRSVL